MSDGTSGPSTDGLPRGVIFDMDGVLLDSEPFICKAACMMFAERGLQVKPEDFLPFVGAGENLQLRTGYRTWNRNDRGLATQYSSRASALPPSPEQTYQGGSAGSVIYHRLCIHLT